MVLRQGHTVDRDGPRGVLPHVRTAVRAVSALRVAKVHPGGRRVRGHVHVVDASRSTAPTPGEVELAHRDHQLGPG